MRINLRRDSEEVLWLTACWFTEWDTESSLKKKNNLTNSHQIDADKPHLKPMAHPQKPTVRQMSLEKSQQESKRSTLLREKDSDNVHGKKLGNGKMSSLWTQPDSDLVSWKALWESAR